jgi:hypothetical protein
MQISGSYRKKPGSFGCMQFDHDITVLSIQIIITLHQRFAFQLSLLSVSFCFFLLLLILTESFLFYHNGGIRKRSINRCSFPCMKKIDKTFIYFLQYTNWNFHIHSTFHSIIFDLTYMLYRTWPLYSTRMPLPNTALSGSSISRKKKTPREKQLETCWKASKEKYLRTRLRR